MNKRLGVLIYDQVQPMDIIGPWEVLSTWKTILGAPIDLYLVSEKEGDIVCSNQITLKSHCSFDNSPTFDYLLIPGGPGRKVQMYNNKLLDYLKVQANSAEYILSVCTGTFLLYKAGLLSMNQITTYWRALPELRSLSAMDIAEKRIVKSGKIWTTGGISSGIDLAFEFIAAIAGNDAAGKVQLLFEYFPETTIYCDEKMVHELPLYNPQDLIKANLPDYIEKYIKERAKD